MPGILPEIDTAGAVVYRDANGNPTNPPNVNNAYAPAPPFDSNCLLTALPSDCDARIEPRQINAIVSELLSFAECLNPGGSWDCNSLRNLCESFTQWALVNLSGIYVGDTPPVSPDDSKLWWESDTGVLYIYYNDGNTTQWVQINAINAVVMDNVSIVGAGTTAEPYQVGLIDCGTW